MKKLNMTIAAIAATAPLLLLSLPQAAPTQDVVEKEFFSALDRFYTWGDVVKKFSCRVHGRWLQYEDTEPKIGEFWGDLQYEKGKFKFKITRILKMARTEKEVERDIRTLVEQAGLLPTGFPVPRGKVVRHSKDPASSSIRYDVVSQDPDIPGTIMYRISRGRMVEVSIPRGKSAPPLRFKVKSYSIPGQRYLITQLISRSMGYTKCPWISYHYHYLGGNYFPRAINEDRKGESLSLQFFRYEIHMKG